MRLIQPVRPALEVSSELLDGMEIGRDRGGSEVTALELLQQSSIDWTYLSPSAFFEPGPRTGKFRLGQDELLTAPDGKSSISMEDYAIALVDELEQTQHRRQRFTVGY